jgi:hypothetical protein
MAKLSKAKKAEIMGQIQSHDNGVEQGRADCLAEVKKLVDEDKYFSESDKYFFMQILDKVAKL